MSETPAAPHGARSSFSTRRPVAVTVVFVAAAVFGIFSCGRLPVNLMPDLSYPTLTVRTEYPGSAPEEVENDISRPVEEALGVVGGLQRISSVSRAGVSDVLLEFAWDVEMSDATQDVLERLDQVFLPEETERPLILQYDPSLDPVMELSLSGEGERFQGEAGLRRLRRLAELQVKRKLEPVKGVAAVRLRGGLEEEIHVLLDEQKLRLTGISAATVIRRLREENINVAGGTLREGETEYMVRTLNEYENLDQIADTVVVRRDGRDVRIRDLGEVENSHKERQILTRTDGGESVQLEILKEADANIVDLAKRVRASVGDLDLGEERKLAAGEKPESKGFDFSGGEGMPAKPLGLATELYRAEGAILQVVADRSTFIESSVKEVVSTAVIGGLLAVLVLFLFLRNVWTTLIAGLAIPISLLVTFGPLNMAGVSLNIMSLGGLALGIGMLVDSSIVVLESIFRCREEGDDLVSAAVRGTEEVRGAVAASTLTSIAVFFPMVFVEGIAGQIFGDLGLAVVFSLLVSLVAAVYFIPMMASLRWNAASEGAAGEDAGEGARPSIPSRLYSAWLDALGAFGGWRRRFQGLRKKSPWLQALLVLPSLLLALLLFVLATASLGLITGVVLVVLVVALAAGLVTQWRRDFRRSWRRLRGRDVEGQAKAEAEELDGDDTQPAWSPEPRRAGVLRRLVTFPLRVLALVGLALWYLLVVVLLVVALPLTAVAAAIVALLPFSQLVVKLVGPPLVFALSALLALPLWLTQKTLSWLGEAYPRALRSALGNVGAVLAAALLIFAVTGYAVTRLGNELLPEVYQGEFTFEVALPVGTPLEVTEQTLSAVEAAILEEARADAGKSGAGAGYIDSVLVTYGFDPATSQRSDEGEHSAKFKVLVVRPQPSLVERMISSLVGRPRAEYVLKDREAAVMARMRRRLSEIPDLEGRVVRPVLFSFRTPVEVEVHGNDLLALKRQAEQVREAMADIPLLADVEATLKSGAPEVQIVYDRDLLSRYDLNILDVAELVRDQVKGSEASRFNLKDRRIPILVRLAEEDRQTVADVENLLVNPGSQRPIPLSAVAAVDLGEGPSEVRRVDGQRVALVTANLSPEAGASLGAAVGAIRRTLDARVAWPPEMTYFVAGQNEEWQRSQRSLWIALGLSIFLVYVIMAAQFESLLQPLVIMFTIPLAFFGTVLTLWWLGISLSVVVFLGMIMLAGIVVNNAIVLVDYINTLKARGMESLEAIVTAGAVRLRPILMTTATTVLGLLPMALGLGDGAEIRTPMAITVIAGLLASTVLTLIIIPVIYSLFDRLQARLAGRRLPELERLDGTEDADYLGEPGPVPT